VPHRSGERGQVMLGVGGAFGSPSTPALLRGRSQLGDDLVQNGGSPRP
jgi:hypothetical protein